jgi:hypothetical protein
MPSECRMTILEVLVGGVGGVRLMPKGGPLSDISTWCISSSLIELISGKKESSSMKER